MLRRKVWVLLLQHLGRLRIEEVTVVFVLTSLKTCLADLCG